MTRKSTQCNDTCSAYAYVALEMADFEGFQSPFLDGFLSPANIKICVMLKVICNRDGDDDHTTDDDGDEKTEKDRRARGQVEWRGWRVIRMSPSDIHCRVTLSVTDSAPAQLVADQPRLPETNHAVHNALICTS